MQLRRQITMEQYLRSLPVCGAVIVDDNLQNSRRPCKTTMVSSQVEVMPRLTRLTIHDARKKLIVNPRRRTQSIRHLPKTSMSNDALVGSRWSLNDDRCSTVHVSNLSAPRRRLSDDIGRLVVPCLSDILHDNSVSKSEQTLSYVSKSNNQYKNSNGTTTLNEYRKRGCSMQALSKEAIQTAKKSLELLVFDSDDNESVEDDNSDHSTESTQCAYSIYQHRRKLFLCGQVTDSIVELTKDAATFE